MRTKHLLVDLSSHGFGHFAQTSMVLNALHRLNLPIRVTLRSTLPESIIRERLEMPVTVLHQALDVGMKMHDAVAVDTEASFDYYHTLHKGLAQAVTPEVEGLSALKPDLILANVPYLSLIAAKQLGIPTLAMCSLNWAEIFAGFCQNHPGADQIVAEIRSAYASAEQFLAVTPHMPMPGLENLTAIPPIAHYGQKRTEALRLQIGNEQARFVLVNLGGIPTHVSTELWPRLENVYWVVASGVDSARDDVISQDAFDLPFIDLLSSCQAVLTKTGYGMLVEATVNQVPVVCIERGDWPEEPALFNWTHDQGYLQTLSMDDFNHGHFADEVMTSLNTCWEKLDADSHGARVAADIIHEYLT